LSPGRVLLQTKLPKNATTAGSNNIQSILFSQTDEQRDITLLGNMK